MNNILIQVGRRTIPYNELEAAVKASYSVRDVQKLIGWSDASTTTIKLGKAIQEAEINTDHFKYPIGAPPRYIKEFKQYNIAEVNQPYFDWAEAELPKIYTPESYKGTYRFIFGNFLEFVGDQDIIKATEEQIKTYAEGKVMRENVVRAILKRIVLDNINKSRFNVGKALLFYLLEDGKMKK